MDDRATKVVAAYVVTVVAAQREVAILEDGRVFGRWAGADEWEVDTPVPM